MVLPIVLAALFTMGRLLWGSDGVPRGNGGGNGHDGALPDNADVPRIDHAAEAPAQSPPRIPEAEHINSEKHRDEGHPRTGPFDEAATPRPPTREMPGTGSPAKSSKKRKRENWTKAESSKLEEERMQRPNRNIRKVEWEAISEQIPGKTKTWIQCQQKWDTVLRPYSKIKDFCDTHHKAVGQGTDAELQSLRLDTYMARNRDSFNKISEYKSGMPGEGSSAPSTSTVGERGLPVAATDVLLPTSMTTALQWT